MHTKALLLLLMLGNMYQLLCLDFQFIRIEDIDVRLRELAGGDLAFEEDI